MKRFVPILLAILASPTTMALNDSDFYFREEGETVTIDNLGTRIHIDYIGAALTRPLKITVRPTDSELKLVSSTCHFTKANPHCLLNLKTAKKNAQVYGIHSFELTEANPPVMAARAVTNMTILPTSFNVGVQAQNSPAPMKFILYVKYQSGKMIVTNRTGKTNPKPAIDYRMRALSNAPGPGTFSSAVFSLPNSSSCYLDVGLTGSAAIYYENFSSYLQDVTNPEKPIFNMIDSYTSSPDRLGTCSARGKQNCASDKWASMTFGLMNIGSRDLEGGLKAGESETLKDNGWKSGSYINYAEDTTVSNPLAVLFIQA